MGSGDRPREESDPTDPGGDTSDSGEDCKCQGDQVAFLHVTSGGQELRRLQKLRCRERTGVRPTKLLTEDAETSNHDNVEGDEWDLCRECRRRYNEQRRELKCSYKSCDRVGLHDWEDLRLCKKHLEELRG